MQDSPARERHLIRNRANQMQRAVAAVELAIDGLRPVDRLIVLNEVLTVALADRQPTHLALVRDESQRSRR